jgi:replication factor A1
MIFGLSYEEIIEKIKEKGLSQEDVEGKIKEKLVQLSGLISKEGAAQIVANEVGVKIFREVGKVKIKDIRPGMRDIELDGKVVAVYDVRSFKTEKREGRVASFMVGDETGQIRIVLWDEGQIQKVESKQIIDGIILNIKNTYCRDNNGFKELHLNSGSEIALNPPGVVIGEIAVNSSMNVDFTHKKINELTENDRNVILKGTIVQIFDPRFYEVCAQCGKRALTENGVFKCAEHGPVEVKYAAVLNIFFDDGTDAIRIACFRNQAANVLGVNEDDLSKVKDNPVDFETIKNKALGKQLEISGRGSKNEMFNRMEFIANTVEELKPEKILSENDI